MQQLVDGFEIPEGGGEGSHSVIFGGSEHYGDDAPDPDEWRDGERSGDQQVVAS
jgi:hypothetical protein